MVRSGRAAPLAACLARALAQGGRADRAGGVRALPAELARDRPPGHAPRGARPAAGARSAGLALGVGRPAASGPRLPAGAARRALRVRRRRLGRRRPRPRRRLLPRGCSRPRRSRGRTRAGGRDARAAPCDARAERAILARPPRRHRPRGRRRAARPVGARVGRRGHQRRVDAAPRRPPLRRAGAVTATQGRWSLTGRLFGHGPGTVPGTGPDRRALAELLLERHGIVTRDGVRAEGIPGGYGAVYGELRALETIGVCRRGYFVEGLGGAQFALPGAVERLRELRPGDAEEPDALVLGASDPAQPYGAALPWPKRAGARAARVAGAHVVLLHGEAGLFVERGGRSLVPLRDPAETWLRSSLAALVAHVRRGGVRRLAVERFDGEPVGETTVMPLLVELGFVAGPRRAVLRP